MSPWTDNDFFVDSVNAGTMCYVLLRGAVNGADSLITKRRIVMQKLLAAILVGVFAISAGSMAIAADKKDEPKKEEKKK
jgi:hypothetical protein